MKSSSRLVIATISIAILAGVTDSVQAQDKYALTGNAAVVSDYRYRGITQTRFDPALQVGADLGLPNGLYAGVWATNIKWIKDAGGKGSSEIDLYGGYKTELSKDLLLDVGVLRYQYPGNNYKQIPGTNNDNANTTELYGALTYGPVTAKYSHSLTSLFGVKDSSGSSYFDLTATFDLGGGWSVVPHFGRQVVANNSSWNYNDLALTVTKDFSGVVFGLSAVTVDAKNEGNYQVDNKFTGKSGLVLSAKYNF